MTTTTPGMGTPTMTPRARARLRRNLGWLIAVVALAVSAALVFAVVDSDSDSNTGTGSEGVVGGLVEHGSITAIDHRDATRADGRNPQSVDVLQDEKFSGRIATDSINAIERRALDEE